MRSYVNLNTISALHHTKSGQIYSDIHTCHWICLDADVTLSSQLLKPGFLVPQPSEGSEGTIDW